MSDDDAGFTVESDADAITVGMHAITHARRDVVADKYLTEKERARRLDELDAAHDRLRALRRPLVAIPTLPHASDGADSVGPTATTPDATAECAGLGDGID